MAQTPTHEERLIAMNAETTPLPLVERADATETIESLRQKVADYHAWGLIGYAERDSARAEVERLEYELDKWRNWHPDDETLADAQRQAFNPNGDHGVNLAAMVVYVRVLEERIRRHESEAAALREQVAQRETLAEAVIAYQKADADYCAHKVTCAYCSGDAGGCDKEGDFYMTSFHSEQLMFSIAFALATRNGQEAK